MIGACEYCKTPDKELRPYGKNGANICFKCGMENREETDRQFNKILDEVDTVVMVYTDSVH